MLAALQKVVDRHDIYRTAVVWEGLSEPVQVVNRRAQVPVSEVLLAEDAENAESAGNAADRSGIEAGSDTEAHSDTEVHSDTEMAARLLAAAGSRMDLQRAPLIRAFVAELPGTGKWQVLVQMHHLLQDHTSRVVFLEEIAAVLRGDDAALTEPLPFRAFVAHARLGISREEHGRFFAGLLGDVTETTAPFGLLDVHGDGSDVEHARVPLDTRLAARIREQARRSGVSAATLFHVAWARVLASVSGREDVVFGISRASHTEPPDDMQSGRSGNVTQKPMFGSLRMIAMNGRMAPSSPSTIRQKRRLRARYLNDREGPSPPWAMAARITCESESRVAGKVNGEACGKAR